MAKKKQPDRVPLDELLEQVDSGQLPAVKMPLDELLEQVDSGQLPAGKMPLDEVLAKLPQSRAAKPGISLERTRYKAPMHLETQKFKDTKKQMSLFTAAGLSLEVDEEREKLTIRGLDSFSLAQSKALSAVQINLDKVGYKGINVRQEYSSVHKDFFTVSEIPLPWTQYFEAYGITGKGTGRTKLEQEAIDALYSLAEPRRITYRRDGWTGDGKHRKKAPPVTIFEEESILKLSPLYVGLTEEEETAWRETGKKPEGKRSQGVIITIRPLLVDGIEDYYLLKPTDLHPQIQALRDKKRAPKSLSLFCEWLLTLDFSPVKISYEKLAERLSLDYLIETRHKKKLFTMLDECYEVAKQLDILLDYKQDGTGNVVLTLNPDECYRLQKKQLRQKKPKALPGA